MPIYGNIPSCLGPKGSREDHRTFARQVARLRRRRPHLYRRPHAHCLMSNSKYAAEAHRLVLFFSLRKCRPFFRDGKWTVERITSIYDVGGIARFRSRN